MGLNDEYLTVAVTQFRVVVYGFTIFLINIEVYLEGFQKNNLKPAYWAIKRLKGGKKESHKDTTVTKLDGSVCSTPPENDDRWREHYQAALNHSPATFSPDLEDATHLQHPTQTSQRTLHL